MRRRSLIAGAAAAPLAAFAARASACTIVRPDVGEGAAQLALVERLFRQWWSREEHEFLRAFLGVEGDLLTPDPLAERITQADLFEHRELYGRFFAEPERYRELLAMTAVDRDVFVACAEHAPGGLAPNCSNGPTTHLFLIGFHGERPRELHHIKSAASFAIGQVVTWSR